jgi:hypothetical protein
VITVWQTVCDEERQIDFCKSLHSANLGNTAFFRMRFAIFVSVALHSLLHPKRALLKPFTECGTQLATVCRMIFIFASLLC